MRLHASEVVAVNTMREPSADQQREESVPPARMISRLPGITPRIRTSPVSTSTVDTRVSTALEVPEGATHAHEATDEPAVGGGFHRGLLVEVRDPR
jgi:hypothetical protein